MKKVSKPKMTLKKYEGSKADLKADKKAVKVANKKK